VAKKIAQFLFVIFSLTILGIFLHMIPDDGFTFLNHPQSASWLLGICVLTLPIWTWLILEYIQTHQSFLSSKEKMTALLMNHQQTKKLSLEKSHFLATISHEIRNPLQAIMGTHELLLKDQQLKKDQRKLIQNAHLTCKSLVEVLNQVLDLSKMEAGKTLLTPQAIDIKDLIELSCQSFRGMALKRNITFKTHIDPNLAPSLMIDGTRLKQVLANLIHNSIKFTQQGSILVSLHVLSDTHANQFLQIQVIDSGCGISKEDLMRVMEPYERAPHANHSQIQGSGLGLSITNQLLESMGSSLTIESTPHLGTSASFRVMCQRSTLSPQITQGKVAQPNSVIYTKPYAGKHVLIIDDYPACQEIIQQQCQHLGFSTWIANDASSALKVIQEQKIDVVISDEFMPDISGSALAQVLRKSQANLKVILLTGDHLFHQKKSLEDSLVDACLLKPILIDELFQTLQDVFSQREVSWSFSALLEFSECDNSTCYGILSSILETQKEIEQELIEAFNQMDFSQVGHLTHKILSGARLIGAKKLIELCQAYPIPKKETEPSQLHQILTELKSLNHELKQFLQTIHEADG
jgi:two-component system, NarL family, sensor histidine kinase EvgS